MLFNSIAFGLFFPLVFYLYWLVANKNLKVRNAFLLAVSYLFYGWWDWRFLSLIFISSIIDYISGLKIHSLQDKKAKKKWLILSVLVNLSFLGFFKYFNFFIGTFTDLMDVLGVEAHVSTLNIILPVGISFYTFQTMSYTLDIYRGKFTPTKDPIAFFAFVSFFPQLVAGPIERAKDLLPQFYKTHKVKYDDLKFGAMLMLWGFFKKIVLADRFAIYVDNFYDADVIDFSATFIAVVFFALQLYLDFAAYSDIAIGLSRMLGFELSKNFNQPYFAFSFSDFWKRWHITLSSWFKDYLYIPLGGNKVSKWLTKRNIIIVFFVSGMWHGASWNFAIWGILNGLFLVVLDQILLKKKGLFQKVVNAVVVTGAWSISLIFFRAKTFGAAIHVLKEFFSFNFSSDVSIYDFGIGPLEFKYTIYLILFLIFVEVFFERQNDLRKWKIFNYFIFRWAVYLSILLVIIFLGSYGVGLNDNNFIYFQF